MAASRRSMERASIDRNSIAAKNPLLRMDRDDEAALGLRAPHRVDLSRALGQWTRAPALAAVLAGEHFAAAGGAEHAPGLTRIEGEREHRGLRLHAHVHATPAHAAVLASEQHADLALKRGARGHPDRLRVAGSLADIAAVGLSVRIQGLEPPAGPVLAAVGAAEQAAAVDGAVDLVGVGGIGGQLQDALGRVRSGSDGDLREAN